MVDAINGTGKEIVAAGGTNIGSAQDYVEIYNIDDDIWRIAKPLPQTLLGAATVQYQASKKADQLNLQCGHMCKKISTIRGEIHRVGSSCHISATSWGRECFYTSY